MQLGMAQSGLSRALVDIEECVGGTAFERTTKGMRPTALGQALCRHADAILADFHKAETDLAAVARGKVDSLRAGCFSMLSSWPLSDAVVVENRPGTSGIISTNLLAHSNPDGYTLGVVVASTLTIVPHATVVSGNRDFRLS